MCGRRRYNDSFTRDDIMTTTLKVYSGNSMSASFGELMPPFERANACKVEITFGPAKVMLREIEAGRTADVGILGAAVMAQAVQLGKMVPDSVRVLARNGVGVGVRAGAPWPDLRSVESFRMALLGAKSIAYTSEGASGLYFAELIERLGIAEQIKAKARTRSGGLIAELVVNDEAEIAVQQIPEIRAVAGIDYVGPLPLEIQHITVAQAGIFVDAKQAALAEALLQFLKSPAAAQVFRARGLEPDATAA